MPMAANPAAPAAATSPTYRATRPHRQHRNRGRGAPHRPAPHAPAGAAPGLGGGGKHRPEQQVVEPAARRRRRPPRRARAPNGRSESPADRPSARLRAGIESRPQVHAVRAGGQRHVDAIVHQHAGARPAHRLDAPPDQRRQGRGRRDRARAPAPGAPPHAPPIARAPRCRLRRRRVRRSVIRQTTGVTAVGRRAGAAGRHPAPIP